MRKCKALFAGALLIAACTGAISHVGTDHHADTATAVTSVSITAAQAPTQTDLILVHLVLNVTSTAATGPAGYTCQEANTPSSNTSYNVCYHIAGAGESATLGAFTFASAKYCYFATEWSGVNIASPVLAWGSAFTSTSLTASVTYPTPTDSPILARVVGMGTTSVTATMTGVTNGTVDLSTTGSTTCPSSASWHQNGDIITTGSVTSTWNGTAGSPTIFYTELNPNPNPVTCTSYMGLLGIGC